MGLASGGGILTDVRSTNFYKAPTFCERIAGWDPTKSCSAATLSSGFDLEDQGFDSFDRGLRRCLGSTQILLDATYTGVLSMARRIRVVWWWLSRVFYHMVMQLALASPVLAAPT